jgi:Tfp pilus assembly protein FimT
MLKLLLVIALIAVVVMFVVPALRRRSGRGP